ncbi:MAG TPA: hypothetical protein VE955_02315 [Candidatus Dormibacteraeota bacterium]|jgi:hypothetical protein|nr:hypothetical protein [Candidatus Dormibacteraeota bacterium]
MPEILNSLVEVGAPSSLEVIDFRKLKNRIEADAWNDLVNEYGIVYVTSITRTGCSGCETQKPLFQALADRMTSENSGKVKFRRFHVDYAEQDKHESWDSKRMFHHAAYPTYLVHLRSHVGPLEIFRAVYPSMEELEKQVRESFELADYYKTEAAKT